MTTGLKEYLDSKKKIFKLVCAAGNECQQDVERLVLLYSHGGAQMFDISANVDILRAAKKGAELSKKTQERFFCVSCGIKGDPHVLKAKMDKTLCQQCNRCAHVCPNGAIASKSLAVERCIGCGKCEKVCPAKAIEMYSSEVDLDRVLPELVKEGIDCIEFHVTSLDDSEVFTKWESINQCFDGILSICIDRSNLGNKQVLERVGDLIAVRKPFTTIVQADGIPMSGSDNTYRTTLQAVAMAQIIEDAKLPVYLMLSGGTNAKTCELANMCEIDYCGVAVGSYARKLVRPYILREDFYSNDFVFSEALEAARALVSKVI